MNIRNFLFACLSFCLFCPASVFCQDDDKQVDGATVKGRIVQNDRKEFQIELGDLNAKLNQQVQLPQPPLPKNWQEMKVEQRKEWIEKFEASDEGKALIEKRKSMIDAAARFDLKIEKNGNFVVYDVPAGTYGMRGRLENNTDGKSYVYEVFGQIQIAEEVEEVLLDPVMVSVTRILKTQEDLPEFQVPTFDGKAIIQNKLLKDKFVLFSFWALESPPSLEFSKNVQTLYKTIKGQHEIQLVSICVGSDSVKALDYVKKNNILGWHGYAKSWQHKMIDNFGIRMIPSLILASKEGKILMTHYDFNQAFRSQDADLQTIITNAITGKNIPTPIDKTSTESPDEQQR